MKKRSQTLTLTVASGAAIATPIIGGKITTDSAFERVTGMRVYETGNTAQVYRIGLLSGSSGSVIRDLAYKNDWLATTAVAREGRTVPLELEAKGSIYAIQIDPIVQLSENVDLDVVFDLESDQ